MLKNFLACSPLIGRVQQQELTRRKLFYIPFCAPDQAPRLRYIKRTASKMLLMAGLLTYEYSLAVPSQINKSSGINGSFLTYSCGGSFGFE